MNKEDLLFLKYYLSLNIIYYLLFMNKEDLLFLKYYLSLNVIYL